MFAEAILFSQMDMIVGVEVVDGLMDY